MKIEQIYCSAEAGDEIGRCLYVTRNVALLHQCDVWLVHNGRAYHTGADGNVKRADDELGVMLENFARAKREAALK